MKQFLILLSIMIVLLFGSMIYTQDNKEVEYITTTGEQETNIKLLTLYFNDTNINWAIDFKASFLTPGAQFVRESSGGIMKLSLVSEQFYTSTHNELYYGEDIETADTNIFDLLNEIKNFKENDTVLIVLHPGIAQELQIGNTSGIIDQYFDYPSNSGIILLSYYSGWAIMIHEIGHYWGLPDLYFKNQIGVYGLMGQGVWHSYDPINDLHGTDGTDPSDFCPWSKLKLGWLNYYNSTGVKSFTTSWDNAVIIENLVIQYVEKGVRDPGVLVLWDKYRDTEKADVLENEGFGRYVSNDRTIIVQVENNEIKVTYALSFNWSFEYTLYNVYRAFFILLLIAATYYFTGRRKNS